VAQEEDEPKLPPISLETALRKALAAVREKPSSKAKAIEDALEAGATVTVLAAHLGIDRNTIHKYQHLLKLDPKVQDAVDEGRISLNEMKAAFFDRDNTGQQPRLVAKRGQLAILACLELGQKMKGSHKGSKG
jgi:hypothetical protein